MRHVKRVTATPSKAGLCWSVPVVPGSKWTVMVLEALGFTEIDTEMVGSEIYCKQ